ncbi:glycoside hydrolase family 9 protein [Cellulomonas composti]|uniref:Endoglucanase n=1 Tax=Cellulomonas composti TaxID=266130 RepID=A0A511J9F2_9CELL|nr:glycoside hydrolase family 9 protein [Cellulomonas composti]GEL94389.1 endoglucanase [Cellulomonas composti]
MGPDVPRLLVNQHGYRLGGPVRATLVSEQTAPVPWWLRRDGATLAAGLSRPHGFDASSGLHVHVVDVALDSTERPVGGPAQDVRLETADGARSDPVRIAAGLYDELAADSLAVFYGQRSGIEIDAARLGPGYGRAAGHVAGSAHGGDTRVPCLPAGHAVTAEGVDLYDGWTDTHVLDVTGGWYDAGDHGKYVVNGAVAVAQLLSSYERAHLRGVDDPDEVPAVLDEARWELEWLLRMQVPAGRRHSGMAHHKVADERWTGIPTLPADDPQRRFLHRPSTAATLDLAAAAAQGARVWRAFDPAFADRLLAAALVAYEAAERTPDLFAPDTNVLANPGSGPYDDTDLDDERAWAAAELACTTGDERFVADLAANPFLTGAREPFVPGELDWRRTAGFALLTLAASPGGRHLPTRHAARARVVAAADALVARQAANPFGHPYVPDDGRYDWGSNGLLLNDLVVVATAHDVTGERRYLDAVAEGMDYLLGRNALGLSYVTGYGARSVQNQHSRWYAHQVDPTTPHPPRGTVSGGPNSGTPDPVSAHLAGSPAQLCFVDDIAAWGVNEMAVNWSSALAWVAAFLADLEG